MTQTTVDGLKSLGHALRDQRLRRGWPLKTAARRAELPEPTYASYERGDRNPQIDVLVKVLDVYGLRLVVAEDDREARIRALREELARLEASA